MGTRLPVSPAPGALPQDSPVPAPAEAAATEAAATAAAEETAKKAEPKATDFYKSDADKSRAKATDAEARAAAAEAKVKEMEDKNLQSQNNYKELYDREKAGREKAEANAAATEKARQINIKSSAIETAAIKAGIDPDYLEFLKSQDASIVQLETTSTGNTNVLGTDTYIAAFKEKYPKVFKDATPPNINTLLPDGTKVVKGDPNTFSPAQLLELQRKNPAEYKKVCQNKLQKK